MQNQINNFSHEKSTASFARRFFLLFGCIFIASQLIAKNHPEVTKRTTLQSNFTTKPIVVDGIAESAWNMAKSSQITISMNDNVPSPESKTTGNVRSLWDGAILYVLIQVTDTDINTISKNPSDKDGVEIYVDFWNDKFPKNEEDDGIMRISSDGELSGSGVYADRFNSYAAKYDINNEKVKTGYSVELAINIGGIKMENGSSIGIDFCINDAVSPNSKTKYRIFWSDGNNRGLDDNSRWGNVVLTGYNGKTLKAIDTYSLQTSIKKAEVITRGIWENEENFEKALASAKRCITSTSQSEIDRCNNELSNAVKLLRRKGKFPDPFDLPEINDLPDPFTFLNRKKVETLADWNARRIEIKDLAQYYEYGYMPEIPEKVTAVVNDKGLMITVTDKGKTATFDALLTIPTEEQCGRKGPYPVVVSIDFWKMKPSDIYLKAGYAVLSIIYSSVASDNYKHTGAFYELYPYNIVTGNDAGTLLAWAWGASRAVDALKFLSENNPASSNTFDLNKLVVAGFSRCGKAALFAGLMDERFGVVNPGASGCGGAAVYRYVSFGNAAHPKAPYGNIYSWGVSSGCEVLGDKIRHQGHNSNEMLPRFLNSERIYKTNTNGYGERLPYDHHEIIAAIAPRAVIITAANDDYANNAEGDCIGMEGAKPVFEFLNAGQNLALNLRTTGEKSPWGGTDGHWMSNDQIKNMLDFSNMIFYGTTLSPEQKTKFYSNPYYPTFDTYYGGLKSMMPWLNNAPNPIPYKTK